MDPVTVTDLYDLSLTLQKKIGYSAFHVIVPTENRAILLLCRTDRAQALKRCAAALLQGSRVMRFKLILRRSEKLCLHLPCRDTAYKWRQRLSSPTQCRHSLSSPLQQPPQPQPQLLLTDWLVEQAVGREKRHKKPSDWWNGVAGKTACATN